MSHFPTVACLPLTKCGNEGNTCFWESNFACFLLNTQQQCQRVGEGSPYFPFDILCSKLLKYSKFIRFHIQNFSYITWTLFWKKNPQNSLALPPPPRKNVPPPRRRKKRRLKRSEWNGWTGSTNALRVDELSLYLCCNKWPHHFHIL